MRCPALYQPYSEERVIRPVRCTREEGHPIDGLAPDLRRELHEWMRKGQAVRWPNSACMTGTLPIGTRVHFTQGDLLVRTAPLVEGENVNRIWRTRRDSDRELFRLNDDDPNNDFVLNPLLATPVSAFIIGRRTLSNGYYQKGQVYRDYETGYLDGDPDVYEVDNTFLAYLVVRSGRSKVERVRIEDALVMNSPW